MERRIANAVLCTIAESGPMGAPGGIIYAGLMSFGVTLAEYQGIEGFVLSNGLATKHGECLVATPKLLTAFEGAKAKAPIGGAS